MKSFPPARLPLAAWWRPGKLGGVVEGVRDKEGLKNHGVVLRYFSCRFAAHSVTGLGSLGCRDPETANTGQLKHT